MTASRCVIAEAEPEHTEPEQEAPGRSSGGCGVGQRRRLLVVLAFLCACTLLGLCIVGVYLPIYELAGTISSE